MATLEELSGEKWPDAKPSDTSLIQRCTRYAKTPLEELGLEGMRTLLLQGCFLSLLIPKAGEVLQRDAWLQASLYPGDLLNAFVAHADEDDAKPFRKLIKDVARQALAANVPDHQASTVLIQKLEAIAN